MLRNKRTCLQTFFAGICIFMIKYRFEIFCFYWEMTYVFVGDPYFVNWRKNNIENFERKKKFGIAQRFGPSIFFLCKITLT